ncbi:uncharacterized protein si:dkey-283b1.6 [Pimephales promelas]|uniref:uncharacterized protein si:dkey-283b1.6 n=1 Tax=Pimephales promelas TaxID=90988 RepID=UPI00195591E8|nr:uncharacterized protein si:dkey-283b1.6 [Pimephales promelas]XP_039543045.1 uncharacterized protein si:dkey-283b1.6 [Pimephales promelas]KAG1968120.1 wu:fb63c12 [Pimephales promelas]
MDMSDSFILLKIFAPILTFTFLTICCTGLCKLFQRARKERVERLQGQARAVDLPSVYVIPISMSEDELHRPPRYSTVQFYEYEPPPAYHELCLKPEASPLESPPAYSESVSNSPSQS